MDIESDGPTLVLHGAFDVRSTSQVRHAIYEHLDTDGADLVLDMTDVTTIDATALRLLAVATRHAWLTGHHLTVRNPGPAVRRMAHLTRLAHALEVERVVATPELAAGLAPALVPDLVPDLAPDRAPDLVPVPRAG